MPKFRPGLGRNMKTSASVLYRRVADNRLQSFLVYLLVSFILLISIGGVVSSTLLFLLIGLGVTSLVFDSSVRQVLSASSGPRLVTSLLVLIIIWQGLGILFRTPSDPRAASVLGSALGIVMLLTIVLAAELRDDKFLRRFLIILFLAGVAAAAVSLFRYSLMLWQLEPTSLKRLLLRYRLTPIGRAEHPILGAGGLAASFFAGLTLCWDAEVRRKGLVVFGLVLIALTIMLTQSRGPLLGIALAVTALGCIGLFRSPTLKTMVAFGFVVLCFLAPVGLIVGEPWVKSLICDAKISICRPSNRQEVWANVLEYIAAKPWLGVGPGFRFSGGGVSHPHNGLLGLSFYFGIPVSLLFIGIMCVALKQALIGRKGTVRTFALLGIFFSASFIATDLSNPFGFVNTHYLYLWLPVFMGVLVGALRERPEATPNISIH